MIAALALLALISEGGPETYGTRGADYSAALGSAGGTYYTFAASTRSYAVTSSISGSTLPILFGFGDLVVLQATGGALTCAFTESSSVTMSAPQGAAGACGGVDPSGPDGRTPCFDVPSGQKIDQVPKYVVQSRSIGARVGSCNGRRASLGGELVTVPCAVGGDCTDAGAGDTCDTGTPVGPKLGSVMLVCHASAASAVLHVRVEK